MKNLEPYYITGLFEGEGWFGVSISYSQKEKLRAGAQVSLNIGINMNQRETALIESVRDYFGCGTIEIRKNGMIQYRVRKFSDIVSKIIPFFDKYPFVGGKLKDYEIFKLISNLMKDGKHLTKDGFENILKIKKELHLYF